MHKIGIIGFGNMGEAIGEQLKGYYQVFAYDKDKSKLKHSEGINIEKSCLDLVGKVDTVILAVKPQDLQGLLKKIKPGLRYKLVVSIAAGVKTTSIEKALGPVRIIRVMPNIPARMGLGVSCLSQGRFSSLEDIDFVEELFSYLGETLRINEGMMNAATAVSGSGPAYVCYFLKQKSENFLQDFESAAEDVGFNAQEAAILTKATYFGSREYIKKAKLSSAGLIKQVASRGGTTQAALEVLDKGGSLKEAVKAALKRAEELSAE